MNSILANWPAAKSIRALTTSRRGGHSQIPYDSNNLGLHVGDTEASVLANRRQLRDSFAWTREPIWLQQTHSNRCTLVEEAFSPDADAAVTRIKGQPLAIMTADCLPIMLCNQAGTEVAAIHAGWRGLLNGIIENSLQKMLSSSDSLMAWIGPAICQQCFEVGNEVLEAYVDRYPFSSSAFSAKGEKQLANLPQLAELVLRAQGIRQVYQSNVCTFEQTENCYSYRRQAITGRMATLIWIEQDLL